MTSRIAFLNAAFSVCCPRMLRHCTRGRPALIMVANWRVKTPWSRVVMRGLRSSILRLATAFGWTDVIRIRRLRSCSISSCLSSATSSPDRTSPAGVRPFQMNVVAITLSSRAAVSDLRGVAEHLLQLLRIGAAGHGLAQGDQAVHDRGVQRLVHGLHAVLLPRL